MPKGIVNYDNQLRTIESRIEMYSKRLSDLKSQRQLILSKKEESEMQGLYDFISKNNLTVQDVIDKIAPES